MRALPEGRRPWCAGAVVLAGRGPVVAAEAATGWAVRYRAYDPERDRGLDLPRDLWEPMRIGTVFDLASLTKLFTAVVTLQQVERGRLGLDDQVHTHLPDFAPGSTVRNLLTHTSGLRAELPFYERRGRAAQLALLWAESAAPAGPPGGAYHYSDLNLIALQLVLESLTGRGLDVLVREGITRPLGMASTSYGPLAPPGVAATEDQRRPWAKADRGLLRGVVHDENAWALGGVAGHAGLFATAQDLAVLCRALLGGGAYGSARILGPGAVAALLDPPGLGFAVDQPYFMGELAGRGAAGHTGFTGTSLVLDRATDTFLVLLANTVHPRRGNGGSAPRAAAATCLARAVLR
ncbi:serine hydrolase domain-containing protein [Streptomyces chattanoogensis]|uniref:Esterase n=1 Tax=Streptomyces chattanoogensis TaxID=66876 RepID=A0A0N0GZ73_9ACTN|nr:serine hydrolase [Streptomyces chattanoogensis]KPC62501.1 esterase [Streptomyces chattanoogensis]